MAKKTISVTALSNLQTTVSSGKIITGATAHENTGATATAAPVLLSLAADADYSMSDLATIIANRYPDTVPEQVVRVLESLDETIQGIVDDATDEAAPNIDLGWAKFVFEVSGSLATASETPGAANVPYFSGQVNSEFQKQYARIKASTDVAASPCDLKRIIDVETGVKNVIRGTKAFYADGRGLSWTNAADKQELYKADGTKVCDLTLDTANSYANSMKLNVPSETALALGDYFVRIECTVDGSVYRLEQSVEVIEAVVLPPLLTKVKQGAREDNLVGFGTGSANAVVLTGRIPGGFLETDGLKLDGAPTTATGTDFQATMSLGSYVTASTDNTITLGDGFENDSMKPDSEWTDKLCRFVLTRDGAEYKLVANFKMES